MGRLLLALLLAGCLDDLPDLAHPPADVTPLQLSQRPDPWADAIELVPPVRLPTDPGGTSRTRVYLRLPPRGAIQAPDGPASLRLPPGARLDRVEYVRRPAGWTIADVRGTRVEPGGQRFHALRPIDQRPFAPLQGYTWPRGDPLASRAALRALTRLADSAAYAGDHDCAACHAPARPAATAIAGHRIPWRPTDAGGFYLVRAVMSDRLPLSSARPHDPNADDPYVSLWCGDRPARVTRGDRTARVSCPDGRVPEGVRDVARGLRDGDPYTRRVCAARAALWRRLEPGHRPSFAAAAAACGLASPTRPDS